MYIFTYIRIVNPEHPDQKNQTKLLECHRFLISMPNFELFRRFKGNQNHDQKFRKTQSY